MKTVLRLFHLHERWFVKICLEDSFFLSMIAFTTMGFWVFLPFGALGALLTVLQDLSALPAPVPFSAMLLAWALAITLLLVFVGFFVWVVFVAMPILGEIEVFHRDGENEPAKKRLARLNQILEPQ